MKKTIYLVDYENVNSGGLVGIEKLSAKDDAIALFFTEHASRIDLDIVAKKPKGLRLMARKVQAGNQALDNQLDSILGFLIGLYGNKVNYVIISKDNGFKIMKSLWKEFNIDIQPSINHAVNNKKQVQTKTNAIAASNDEEDSELASEELRREASKRVALNNNIVKELNKAEGFSNVDACKAASLAVKGLKKNITYKELEDQCRSEFGRLNGDIAMSVILKIIASTTGN